MRGIAYIKRFMLERCGLLILAQVKIKSVHEYAIFRPEHYSIIKRGKTMAGPLADVKVIEFAALGPAPMGAMLLADLGADVLTIER